MKESPFFRLADRVAEMVADELMTRGHYLETHWAAHGYESPIEALFLHAISAASEFCRREVDFDLRFLPASEDHDPSPQSPELLILQRQKQIHKFRVDFLISQYATWGRAPQDGRSEGWRSLIVECDGHDFHERTKEQAAKDKSRDRSLVMSGYEVFRFTGSELWRDPLKCAFQVLDWAGGGV